MSGARNRKSRVRCRAAHQPTGRVAAVAATLPRGRQFTRVPFVSTREATPHEHGSARRGGVDVWEDQGAGHSGAALSDAEWSLSASRTLTASPSARVDVGAVDESLTADAAAVGQQALGGQRRRDAVARGRSLAGGPRLLADADRSQVRADGHAGPAARPARHPRGTRAVSYGLHACPDPGPRQELPTRMQAWTITLGSETVGSIRP